MIVVKCIITLFCLLGVINPELVFRMVEGWKFIDTKPSPSYLIVTRVTSAFSLIFIWLL